jgi:Sec-independent protein secretion pathway component TatC
MELSKKLLVAYLMIFTVAFCIAPFMVDAKKYLTIMIPVLGILAIGLGVYTYKFEKQNNNDKKHS